LKYRLACFDLDGTLVDSMADIREALQVALDALPPGDPAHELEALGSAGLGLPLDLFFAIARPGGDETTRRLFIDTYRAHYHAHLLDRTRPFPGVPETLEKLQPLRARGLRTCVATTKKTDTARKVVGGLGLAGYFDVVLGTDGIPHKPAPDLPLLCARTVGREPAHGIMVGDTHNDVLAGRAAGMKTCGVAYGVMGAIGLAPHQPDFMIDAFPEVFELITEWPRAR
jgi:phosphoglycolate phosphatase